MSFPRVFASLTALAGLVAASPAPPGWHGPGPKPRGLGGHGTPPSTSSPPSCQGYFEPLAPPYLDDLAVSAGLLYFGSATDQPGTGEDNDYLYQEILNTTAIFGQVTPGNQIKYFATEPENNVFNYTGGNVTVKTACDHGKYLRCHNLIWSNQLPDWIINGSWDAESLTAIMENHIHNLVTHWADVCYTWDVIKRSDLQ